MIENEETAKQQRKDTNFTCFGPLVDDPKPKNTQIGLLVDFTIYYRPEKRFAPCYVNFTCMDSDVAEYIVENFRKGDMMKVKEATPTSRKSATGPVYFKFLVWDIEPKKTAGASSPQLPKKDDDVPY